MFFINKFPFFYSSSSFNLNYLQRVLSNLFLYIGGNSKHQVGRSKICYWHKLRIMALFKVHLHL